MMKLTATALFAAVIASSAFAGGPVVVVEEPPPVVEEKPASSKGIVPARANVLQEPDSVRTGPTSLAKVKSTLKDRSSGGACVGTFLAPQVPIRSVWLTPFTSSLRHDVGKTYGRRNEDRRNVRNCRV
jgi:hypothetical protein